MSESTRIRYKKTVDNTVLVSPDFLGGEVLLRGVIATDTRTASVEEKIGEEYKPVKVTNYVTLAEAKRFIKNSMKEFGVSFYDEVRKKRVKVE